MFYNLIYRSFLWNNLPDRDRNIRVLITGIILYIVAYFAMNSQYTQEMELIQQNKKYIYYLASTDFATVAAQMIFSKGKQIKKQKKRKHKRPIGNHMNGQIPPLLNQELIRQQQILEQHREQLFREQKQHQTNINNNVNPNVENNSSVNLPVYSGTPVLALAQVNDIEIPVYQPTGTSNQLHTQPI
jgi:predicted tellurium resistance membrane protein TerC